MLIMFHVCVPDDFNAVITWAIDTLFDLITRNTFIIITSLHSISHSQTLFSVSDSVQPNQIQPVVSVVCLVTSMAEEGGGRTYCTIQPVRCGGDDNNDYWFLRANKIIF